MNWSDIQLNVLIIKENAVLLPDGSESKAEIFGGILIWEDLLKIVEDEIEFEELSGEEDGLAWERLIEIRTRLNILIEIWNALIFPETKIMSVPSQGLLTKVLNLRMRKTFEAA